MHLAAMDISRETCERRQETIFLYYFCVANPLSSGPDRTGLRTKVCNSDVTLDSKTPEKTADKQFGPNQENFFPTEVIPVAGWISSHASYWIDFRDPSGRHSGFAMHASFKPATSVPARSSALRAGATYGHGYRGVLCRAGYRAGWRATDDVSRLQMVRMVSLTPVADTKAVEKKKAIKKGR
jgi:hypothetical protein